MLVKLCPRCMTLIDREGSDEAERQGHALSVMARAVQAGLEAGQCPCCFLMERAGMTPAEQVPDELRS